MHAAMQRFFNVVVVAILALLASGTSMLVMARNEATRSGLPFNMPLDWYAMIALFAVMLLVFVHIRWALFRRLERAAALQAWPDAAAAIGAIRWEVTINLVIGIFVVVIVRLGGSG
jgi:uncharacterized membrane protein